MSKQILNRDSIRTAKVIFIGLSTISIILSISFFASLHTIISIINESNWSLILFFHLGALACWVIIIGLGILRFIRDDIKIIKTSPQQKIFKLFKIIAFTVLGAFIFRIFTVENILPSFKDVIQKQIQSFEGCYYLSEIEFPKGSDEYYLIPQSQTINKSSFIHPSIIISHEDYNSLLNYQDCKKLIEIKYLLNTKLRLNLSIKHK